MSLDLKVLLVFPYRYSSSFLVRESFPAHRGAELAFLAVPALLVALLCCRQAASLRPSNKQLLSLNLQLLQENAALISVFCVPSDQLMLSYSLRTHCQETAVKKCGRAGWFASSIQSISRCRYGLKSRNRASGDTGPFYKGFRVVTSCAWTCRGADDARSYSGRQGYVLLVVSAMGCCSS